MATNGCSFSSNKMSVRTSAWLDVLAFVAIYATKKLFAFAKNALIVLANGGQDE